VNIHNACNETNIKEKENKEGFQTKGGKTHERKTKRIL